ncbi:uncharacterized protein LOC127787206 [Diospyros lotus]|uniref:uncharacterized protein LOC127787206 n=1 Tax=Diospyros lotus TaxID=55363 RepID=UPI0022565EC7|nr:uncharacterized protein LOC127787206 [Diospyros lotus]
MESTASNSPPPPPPPPPTSPTITPQVADRIIRAIHHRLLLLHRGGSEFFVLGVTGNVYTVSLSAAPSCTCPDPTTPCKHILFVLIRVLGVSLDDACLRRRTLRPCQLNRLLATPSSPETLADAYVRERFHQLFSQARRGSNLRPPVEIEEGSACPVCLDEFGSGEAVVACGTCRNPIHEPCLQTWKRSSRRRSATCVICRARWRNWSDRDSYLNLSAYVGEDEMGRGSGMCAN